jgi:hypothetical protein
LRQGTYEQDIYIAKDGIQLAQYKTMDDRLCPMYESKIVYFELISQIIDTDHVTTMFFQQFFYGIRGFTLEILKISW